MLENHDAWAKFSAEWKPKIERELDRVTSEISAPTKLREAMRYSLLSEGKRLRPLLVLAACDALGGKIDAALPAAIALEMVHAFSLVHDDLPAMDDDDMRRGKPTNHKVYGEAEAILAGDALLALAFEIVAKGLDRDFSSECCGILASAVGASGLCGGQSDDMRASDQLPKIEDALFIAERKTGKLFEAALEMGAVIGGATVDQRASLTLYGQKVGLAFQITDDFLDKQISDEAAEGYHRRAEDLVREACMHVQEFGERAEHLRVLAEQILHRKI